MGLLNSTQPHYPAKTYKRNLYFFNDSPGEYFSSFVLPQAISYNVKPPTPTGEGACSVIISSNMIIFGGVKANKTVQMFNFNTKTWTTLAPMTLAHAFFGCVILPNSYLVLVVSTTPGGDERRSDIYDIKNNTWKVTGSTVNPRAGTSLVALGKRVFAIGGNSVPSPANLSATVEEYDIEMGTWSLVNTPLIGARMNFATLSLPAAAFPNLPEGCKGVQ
jgi:hypothetical protein